MPAVKPAPSPAKSSAPALKRTVAPAKKSASRVEPGRLRVPFATLAGGFQVYGSPVEPRHVSRESIAKALEASK